MYTRQALIDRFERGEPPELLFFWGHTPARGQPAGRWVLSQWFLAATSGKVLVGAAPRDTIWGIGLGAENPRAQHPSTWRGQNLLGFALGWVRDQLVA